jgi:hypothetical protein
MKHFVFAIVLSTAFSIGYAQKITFDVYGGLVSSTLRGDEDKLLPGDARFTRRFAFHGGIGINFPLNDILKINTGLSYTQRGSVIENAESSIYPVAGFTYHKVKIDYLELPLLLTVGSEAVYLIAGPQLSFVVNSDVRGLKSDDWGLKYGVGFDLSRYFMAQLLFYHGLSNMTGDSEVKMHNRYISLVVGVKPFAIRIKDTENKPKRKSQDIPHRTLD